MITPVLKMEGISKNFPGVKALEGVHLELYKGFAHALMGENGAGKSTLMKILGGIYPKDSGTITLNGIKTEKSFKNKVRDLSNKKKFSKSKSFKQQNVTKRRKMIIDLPLKEWKMRTMS